MTYINPQSISLNTCRSRYPVNLNTISKTAGAPTASLIKERVVIVSW